MLVDESMEFTLAHHGVSEVQTVELNLTWTEVVDILCFAILLFQEVDKLIVERTVRNKLQGTDRVGNTLEVVALTMCEVVHRISVPLCACAMMRSVDDTIHDRIAEVHIVACHIELSSKHHATFYRLGSIHKFE